MPLSNVAKIFIVGLLPAFSAGCASPPAPPSECMLSAAGFKALVASTPLQQQHLRMLQAGQVTAVQQTGKHYYVYPDLANHRLYVGTPKEYQAYLALRTRDNMANQPSVNATAASDMRSYLKQDAAMEKADAQDATIPSWAIWPEFGGLGWGSSLAVPAD
jgi:hypothetical protein